MIIKGLLLLIKQNMENTNFERKGVDGQDAEILGFKYAKENAERDSICGSITGLYAHIDELYDKLETTDDKETKFAIEEVLKSVVKKEIKNLLIEIGKNIDEGNDFSDEIRNYTVSEIQRITEILIRADIALDKAA